MKLEIDVVYEREVRFTKRVWLNRIIAPWYVLAAVLVALLCLPALSVGLIMTGKAGGTMLKRVGALYERILG